VTQRKDLHSDRGSGKETPELLFLAHRIPYPPDKGDKIRSWNILRRLADRYRVHLGCFVDDAGDWRHTATLREICASCCFAELRQPIARIRSLGGLWSRRPLSVPYYRDAGLAAWTEGLFSEHRIERVFAFSSPMAQYAMSAAHRRTRKVIDFVDVDSDKWRQYAEKKTGPSRWIYAREARTLLAFERTVAAEFDASLFVSPDEAHLFRTLAPESADKVFHLNNGVDHSHFSPDRDYENPFDDRSEVLVFTGAMDYWPNVDAVRWFACTVLPRIRQARPRAEFCIVGSNPIPEVLGLARHPGVSVTGRVEDVRPYLAHAAAVVAPLRVARGIQNKVLEAMAMAKAVVSTSAAIQGIEAEPDRDFLVADDADRFADAIVGLLGTAAAGELGRRARALVVANYDWNDTLARLDQFVEGPRNPEAAVDS